MKQHEEWLFKAGHDLESARILAAAPHTLRDMSVYHCQQAAEKALKGYLAFTGTPIEKTHDLQILVHLCMDIDTQFFNLADAAIFLNPLATAYRYPEGDLLPDEPETIEAIGFAQQVLQFVQGKIQAN